jgi:hypothetical protein
MIHRVVETPSAPASETVAFKRPPFLTQNDHLASLAQLSANLASDRYWKSSLVLHAIQNTQNGSQEMNSVFPVIITPLPVMTWSGIGSHRGLS